MLPKDKSNNMDEVKPRKEVKPKNSDDIAPGIRKTYEFTESFRNGYTDGKVKEAKEKQKVEMLGQK